MARRFVPVVDVETPRLERNDNDAKFRQHRQFDNPHALVKEEQSKKVIHNKPN